MQKNVHLRRQRLERNWRQQDLAEQLGTTVVTVQRWERGTQHPSAYYCVKLCALFGLSAQELGLVEALPSPPDTTEVAQAVSTPTQEAALWTVPYARNPHFTGRDDLLKQLELLFTGETPDQGVGVRQAALTQTQAIKGLGGIGKTQIAIEYAYRAHLQGRYRDVIWISAANEETILTSFVELARLLPALVPQEETNQHTIIAAILRWLEQREPPWLLLVDNADDLSLVQPYLPRQGHGHILLTTRANAVGAFASSVEVDTMGIMEGAHLLLRRAHRFSASSPDEIDEAINVVIALAQFPLAIDQAGAYLEETGCSLHDYLHIYQQHRSVLLARRGKQTTQYPESVATTWSLSFAQVQRTNPAAAELLQLCAFFAPDHIPEELLSEGASYWPPLLHDAVADRFTFNQMLETLLSFSLVKRLSEERMLSIHRLVQTVQMDRLEVEMQRTWSEQVVRAVHALFPADTKDVATWPTCLRYLEQVEACDTLIQHHQLLLPEAADLLDRTGSYFLEHTMYTQAASLYQRALHICEQQWGPEHPRTATSLNHLGILHRDNGNYREAEPFYQRALRIREQQLGPYHLDTATTLHNLANLYESQRAYAKAEPFYQRALRIREQQLGPHHLDTAATLHNLAILYQDQGNYEQAKPLLQRALYIRESLAPHHPDTAATLNYLGGGYQEQGKYTEAEPFYQRAFEIFEQQFGSSHFYTAMSLYNLAVLYTDQGRYREAVPLCQRALVIYEQHLGSLHAHTADPLACLALLSLKLGKDAQAESLALRALRIHEQHLGAFHPYVALDLAILATLYRDQGNYKQAESLFLRALRINEQAFVSTHPQAAQALHEFALLRHAQDHDDEARSLYERALAARTHTLGATHPRTIETRERLMALLRRMGCTQEAAQLEGVQPGATDLLRERTSASRGVSMEQSTAVAGAWSSVLPACPGCQLTAEVLKSGKNRSGSQRFRCRRCQLYFTPQPGTRQPDQARKAQALALAGQGMSYRRIARQLGVHHRTVSAWINVHGSTCMDGSL
ncbi:FxSxx-COOH system tetratricopeptide repeat protein [Dictyobacter arantiisoli]|uniref:Tetratricopeptide repeat protein n=1 Tax=Dictyobacter arantiisoli TaxID=2014874 RepID=A0A5A5TKA8_9CHLR|nr:FxSxx-COOH system tetratricopeptide repeat protein [Dictyobacter arantiisoli]GCF11469.1 tetratricopeptide repeat protein [Dictyobacter arantiisoli]